MENARASMLLPVHRMTPHLRVRITTYGDSLLIEDRPALLGFVPLRKRRIRLAFAELRSYRFRTVVRPDALVASAAAIAAIFVFHPAVAGIVGLAVAAFVFFALGAPNKAVVITRADGRSWMVRFCRDYVLDVSLALADAGAQEAAPARARPGVAA